MSFLPLFIFAFCYALFVILPKRRSVVAVFGALLAGLSGTVTWHQLAFDLINWNVIGLFFGTLVLAEFFLQSKAPAVISERLVAKTGTLMGTILVLCSVTSLLSMFIENVAVVLLVAPVAFSIADRLNISPVKLLICIALTSNLQGTATLIGDPPSMILGGYMKMGFNDFFVYKNKISIFFFVQAGAIASLAVIWFIFRKHTEPCKIEIKEKILSPVPSILLIILVLILSSASSIDPDFKWLAGSATMVIALLGIFWYIARARWQTPKHFFKALDWDTTFFLIGVFVIVGAVSESGWLDWLAAKLSVTIGASKLIAFVSIVTIAVAASAFVDNVPFLLAMIPVTQKVADSIGAPVPLLMFGLLIGACLGGNITPIGASANIVAVGMLRKRGDEVGFYEFMKIGIPFTIAAVVVSAIFTWLVWK